jgi:hypothetical protein
MSKDAENYVAATHSGAMSLVATAWIYLTNEEEALLKASHCEGNDLLTPEQSRLKIEQSERVLGALDRAAFSFA